MTATDIPQPGEREEGNGKLLPEYAFEALPGHLRLAIRDAVTTVAPEGKFEEAWYSIGVISQVVEQQFRTLTRGRDEAVQALRAIGEEIAKAGCAPGDRDATLANVRALARELAEARAEVGRKDEEIERLYAVVGIGGYQGDAPDEMLVMADVHMGCDAWLYLERLHTMGGDRTNYDPARHTQPVRYVRADLAPAQEGERHPRPPHPYTGCAVSVPQKGVPFATTQAGAACSCRECLNAREQDLEPWERTTATRMIVCPRCRNKRCPHAESHRYACTGSNEPGQVGVPIAPAQEVRS